MRNCVPGGTRDKFDGCFGGWEMAYIENIQHNGYGAPQQHCVILWECVDGIIWVQYTFMCMNTTSLG
jgi:hypothetical protein